MDNLEHIKTVTTWESGGGIMLDLVRLKDGGILAISGEIIVLYADEEDLMGGDASERPVIIREPVEA